MNIAKKMSSRLKILIGLLTIQTIVQANPINFRTYSNHEITSGKWPFNIPVNNPEECS